MFAKLFGNDIISRVYHLGHGCFETVTWKYTVYFVWTWRWPLTFQQVRDLHDRILKQQRIIDQLHEQIKKLTDGQGGGGCDTNVIIQRVRLAYRTITYTIKTYKKRWHKKIKNVKK